MDTFRESALAGSRLASSGLSSARRTCAAAADDRTAAHNIRTAVRNVAYPLGNGVLGVRLSLISMEWAQSSVYERGGRATELRHSVWASTRHL